MLTEYAADIKTAVAYPPASLANTFGEWMAKNDKTQLRISETEKYAHVTFFFNGGVEEPFAGEERILINSPKVATYDLQPEMSSAELTEKLVAAIESGKYDTIICNYPNGDMVGHTGVMEAAIKAVEALDNCIDQVTKAVESVGGQLLDYRGPRQRGADARSGDRSGAYRPHQPAGAADLMSARKT